MTNSDEANEPRSTPPPVPRIPSAPTPVSRDSNQPFTTTWKISLCLVGAIALLIVIASVRIRGGSPGTNEDIAKMSGTVVGMWALAPLVICTVFSLLKSFRKDLRKLAVIAMITWAIVGISQLAQIGKHGQRTMAQNRADKATIDDFNTKTIDLRRRMAQTTTPDEQAKLYQELTELTQASTGKLQSSNNQAEMQAVTKLAAPIHEKSAAYLAETSALSHLEGGWLAAFSKSPETLREGRKQIQKLAVVNDQFLSAFNGMLRETQRRIDAKDTTSGASIPALKSFLATAGEHASEMRKIRQLDTEIYARTEQVLDLLQNHPDEWQRQPNGQIVWVKYELLSQFKKLMAEIDTRSDQQKAIQVELLQSTLKK